MIERAIAQTLSYHTPTNHQLVVLAPILHHTIDAHPKIKGMPPPRPHASSERAVGFLQPAPSLLLHSVRTDCSAR